MIPRNLFPRISMPICFAMFTKSRQRTLVGFALYGEAAAVQRLQTRYRALLAQGHRSVWGAVVRAAFESIGGTATLQDLYREIEESRPTANVFWRAKVRQTAQRIACRIGPGRWELREPTVLQAAA